MRNTNAFSFNVVSIEVSLFNELFGLCPQRFNALRV